MIIDVAPKLEDLTIWAEKLEQEMIFGFRQGSDKPVYVCTFESPTLLTDNARIAKLPSGLRDAVFALYQSYPRRVRYWGVDVSWSPNLYPRVWCPSIDSIFLAQGLKTILNLGHTNNLLEIGCGSGFLSKFALYHNPTKLEVVATDILPDAIRCAENAIDFDRFRAVLVDQKDENLGVEGKFDLLICNPPYIPRPEARRDNAFEGLELLNKIACQSRDLLTPKGRLLVNISTIAGDKPLEWFRKQGIILREMARLRVPLKVNNVTSGLSEDSKAWFKYLQGQKLIEEDPTSNYRFWHTLRLFEGAIK